MTPTFHHSPNSNSESEREREMEGGSRQLRSSSSASKQSEMCDEQFDFGIGKSFIKLIDHDISKKLQIPEEFMVNFKGNVPRRIIIESYINKKCWRVEVEGDENGRVCFGDGWNDVIEAHSLKLGDFLVFKHEEHSIFQVNIYGKNGCQMTTFEWNELGSHKKIEMEETKENESDHECDKKSLEKCQQTPRRLSPYGHGVYKKQGVSRSYTKLLTQVSISENSVSFSITLHKEKNHQFVRQSIPRPVVSAKKLWSMKEVVLRVSDGNSWSVSLQRAWDNTSYLHKGWRKFLDDNKIVGGDKLRFEFISDNLIQVHVTKTSQVEHHSGDDQVSGLLNMDCEDDEPITHTLDEKVIGVSKTKIGTSSGSKRCSFSFTWSNKTTGCYLHIPKLVAKDQNLKNRDRVVLRDPEGKCWPHEVKTWVGCRVALTKGWREFWTGHKITAGDSLYFEFVSENLIEVTIRRGKPPLDQPDTEGVLKNIEPIAYGTDYVLEEVDNALVSQDVGFV